jgi:hypothetical protein
LRKIFEIRVARKELVPFREAMIDANVKLVLIVGFVALLGQYNSSARYDLLAIVSSGFHVHTVGQKTIRLRGLQFRRGSESDRARACQPAAPARELQNLSVT